MKAAYLVTETKESANFLRKVLPQDILQMVEIVSSRKKYGASSLAGTIMSDRSCPVLLIVDAESKQEVHMRAQEQELEMLLLPAASSASYGVYVAQPPIASWSEQSLTTEQIHQLQQTPLIQHIIHFCSETLSQPNMETVIQAA
jgi:hypothetical protein